MHCTKHTTAMIILLHSLCSIITAFQLPLKVAESSRKRRIGGSAL